MAASDGHGGYRIPQELQEVLLDFTVQYLVEQPEDLATFAMLYFTRLQARKPINYGNSHSDDSMFSDEEGISGFGICYICTVNFVQFQSKIMLLLEEGKAFLRV